MHYFDGFIGPKAYFPDVRSNIYPQVCTNLILMEVIGSAPVEVILIRNAPKRSLEKIRERTYLITIPKNLKLKEHKLLFWYFALCIVRAEVHGCLFVRELFGESHKDDIEQFSDSFCRLANAISFKSDGITIEDVQQLLFLTSPSKGSQIILEVSYR